MEGNKAARLHMNFLISAAQSDGGEVTGNNPLPATFAGFFCVFFGQQSRTTSKKKELIVEGIFIVALPQSTKITM